MIIQIFIEKGEKGRTYTAFCHEAIPAGDQTRLGDILEEVPTTGDKEEFTKAVLAITGERWSIDVALMKVLKQRLSDSTPKKVSYIDAAEGKVLPEKRILIGPDKVKYLILGHTKSGWEAVMGEFEGQNKEAVELETGEVFPPDSLFNLGQLGIYKFAGDLKGTPVLEAAPALGESRYDSVLMTPWNLLLYKELNAQPDPNEFPEGALGVMNGKKGMLSSVNYLSWHGKVLMLKPFDSPVFRPFEDPGSLIRHKGGSHLKVYDPSEGFECSSEAVLTSVKAAENIHGYLGMYCQEEPWMFVLSSREGSSEVNIRAFSHETPNANDTQRLLTVLGKTEEYFKVEGTREAMERLLEITEG